MAWGKQVKKGKAIKEEPLAVITVRLSARSGATGGSGSGSSNRAGV